MTRERGPNQSTSRPVLAVTMGDPAGIGIEITIKAWQMRRQNELPAFAFLANAAAVDATAKRLGLDVPIQPIKSAAAARDIFQDALPVLDVPLPSPPIAGQPNTDNAGAIISSIEQAVEAVIRGVADAVVTNPISKSILYHAGFQHPGHTEFLAALANQKVKPATGRYTPVMMLAGKDLRVVPVTIHIPLAAVPNALATEDILNTIRTVAAGLHTDFGIDAPRLAVTGLNPHAGEDGAIGTEEQTIITPAITEARAEGITVTGPYPADTLFHAKARANYDATICMYHDQALIPLKTLAFDEGVNITLGLPFVRTSPDHGTAFDIARQCKATPTSLIAAMDVARQMIEHRRRVTLQRTTS